MKYSEYKKNLEHNPEYQEARSDLELLFAFGDAVLRARLKKDWTQTELARRVGTKQANISRIEAGLANPTLELIQKLCKSLELKPEFLEKEKPSQKLITVHVTAVEYHIGSKPAIAHDRPEWLDYGYSTTSATSSPTKEVVLQ